MKKRILVVNEFSELATGYSTYGKELLKGLHNSGKYEVAEFAAYVEPGDPRIQNIPWRVYANMPARGDEQGIQQYNSSPINHFGAWRFDEVVLDFFPTHILAIRDPWMDSFVFSSPFRKYYRIIWMPTVDSAPQEEAWLNDCIDADAILTYSHYGHRILEKEGSGKINLCGVASPCSNYEELKVFPNKIEHRQRVGLPIDPNANIVGTVMRNQPRKLFPDLFETFRLYLDKYDENSYLYCHTSYPDNGWDIPRLLRDYGLGNRTLFTYICRQCSVMVPQFFADAICVCPNCKTFNLVMPNQHVHLPKDVLGAVYNLFDLYVQYSNAEGFGVPVVEAAACGVPVMMTDATAMEDFSKLLPGMPIPIHKTFLDTGTHAYRFYPSNTETVEMIHKFFQQPIELRRRLGFKTRQSCEQNYRWEETVKVWCDAIDKLESIPLHSSWQSHPKIFNPQINQIPDNVQNLAFANWCMTNILGEPEKINSFYALKLTKDLNYGAKQQGFGGPYLNEHSLIGGRPNWEPFNREIAVQKILEERQIKNFWEQRRCSQREIPYFIAAAHHKG